ncbi:uncharacterized protein K489DRAFT_383080 [Dissoconium aciculare CBS 342.82]|uniref:Uncharacterized protein n=1 Tax=Dissoconium aciculare CBS 342.82 TaxID=1314786 RepID=A0A6J3M071_9PEZI|nr:uncharacterized protein K489DRAFT_383080 [Dissoconium aciculare CBS 342.82]KAF1820287.1 hypothetical protein K489DRAFT_383080 [Dissoconium aciculare CBS 342.82]
MNPFSYFFARETFLLSPFAGVASLSALYLMNFDQLTEIRDSRNYQPRTPFHSGSNPLISATKHIVLLANICYRSALQPSSEDLAFTTDLTKTPTMTTMTTTSTWIREHASLASAVAV